MSFAAWQNIVIGHGRSGPLYRLWDAANRLLGGAMAGKWTIFDCSDSPVLWTGDTDPGSADWIVVQAENAWGTGQKMQVFLGFTASTVALAGFGSKAAGLYMAYSPIGGWNLTDKRFGASLGDWRNASIKQVTGYTTSCTMGLALTSGDASGLPGSLLLTTRSGAGNMQYSFAALALDAPVGLARSPDRSCLAYGAAYRVDASGFWGVATGACGLCPDTGLSAFGAAYIRAGQDYGRDRVTGEWTSKILEVVDTVTAQAIGVIPADALRSFGAPDGAHSSDGTGFAYGLLYWPREETRDGVWV